MEFLKYGGIGWVVTLVGVILAAYYFLYGKRRKRLEVDMRATALLTEDVRERDGLRIELDGRKVNDPHIVDVIIHNVGHKDLASTDFDGATKPVRIPIEAEIIARLKPPNEDQADLFSIEQGSTQLLIPPTKIAVGDIHKVRLLVDGKPVDNPDLSGHPLIDTNLTTIHSLEDKIFGRLVGVGLVTVLASLVCLYLFAYQQGFNKGNVFKGRCTYGGGQYTATNPDWTSHISYGFYGLVPIILFSFIYIVIQIRRWISRSSRLSDKQ